MGRKLKQGKVGQGRAMKGKTGQGKARQSIGGQGVARKQKALLGKSTHG
jgi:hypothetical protein